MVSSYRQLDHCIRSGLIRPSGGGGQGHGSPRRFGLRDLLALVLLGDVLRAGVRVRAIAPGIRFVQRGQNLPSLEQLRGCAVWTDGRAARLVQRGEQLRAPPTSRAVAYLLDLGAAAERLSRQLEEPASITA